MFHTFLFRDFLIFFLLLALSSKQAHSNNEKKLTPYLVNLYCNDENQNKIIYLYQDQDQSWWIQPQVIQGCQINFKTEDEIEIEGNVYSRLVNLNEQQFIIDPVDLNVKLYGSISNKQEYQLNAQWQSKALRPTLPGGYLNYDLSVQHEQYLQQSSAGGIFSLNHFNRFGVGNLDYLLQHQKDYPHAVRLTTTWTLDMPEKIATWRFGDSVTGTAIWTGAVQYGGIQYATNFSTQPGFVPFPLPQFAGDAVVPTNVNFYLNNQLQQSQNVSPGPFTIEGLQVLTGGGDIVVKSTDLLGRETVAVLPYYVNSVMLKPGLKQFSYEFGMTRQNFGIESNDYSQWLLITTNQLGITPGWTTGWHSEWLRQQQTLGLNQIFLIKKIAVASMATAFSHSHQGWGGLLLAGLQRQTTQYNVGWRTIYTSQNFQQIGLNQSLAPKWLMQSNASYLNPVWGTMSVSYTNRIARLAPSINITTLSYSKTLFKKWYFLINFVHQGGTVQENSGFVSFIWAVSQDKTASINYQNNNLNHNGSLILSKNLPTDNGYGYRILGALGNPEQLELDYSLQTNYGLYQASFSHLAGTNNYQLDARGSVIAFDKQWILARKISDSFILAKVPEVSHVMVYRSNQPIAQTNQKGYCLIQQALPYHDNVISIMADDLPLSLDFSETQLHVYPYYRSGALVEFKVHPIYRFRFQLMDEAGSNIPAGAHIVLSNGEKSFVGYQGLTYLQCTKPKETLLGHVQWEGNSCYFHVKLTENNKVENDLGVVKCFTAPE